MTPDFQLDRAQLSIARLDEPTDELHYWCSKTPEERLEAMEYLRQVNYGYDPLTTRLQRVLAVAQLGEIE